jgi:hypothetical protein
VARIAGNDYSSMRIRVADASSQALGPYRLAGSADGDRTTHRLRQKNAQSATRQRAPRGELSTPRRIHFIRVQLLHLKERLISRSNAIKHQHRVVIQPTNVGPHCSARYVHQKIMASVLAGESSHW